MLRSLFPVPHSKAAVASAAILPARRSALMRPSLLRHYSSKGANATAAADISGMLRQYQGEQRCNIAPYTGTDVMDQSLHRLKVMGQLEIMMDNFHGQIERVKEAVATCKKATDMFHDDPDKAFPLWEERLDDLVTSIAVFKKGLDDIARITHSIKGSPLDVMLKEQNKMISEVMEDHDRVMSMFCTEVENLLKISSDCMKNLSRSREELKLSKSLEELETMKKITKGLAACLLCLLLGIAIYLA